MDSKHDPSRAWRARLGDRVLDLLGTKFITSGLVLATASALAWRGILSGADWVYVALGVAGFQGAANAIVTSITARASAREREATAHAVGRGVDSAFDAITEEPYDPHTDRGRYDNGH